MNLNEGLLIADKPKRRTNIPRAKAYNVITVQKGRQAQSKPKKSVFDSTSTSTSEIQWRNHNYSRGTPSSANFSRSSNTSIELDSKIILAITEGRGDATCEVGLAAINIMQPHLILCQISDTHSYFNIITKINLLNPLEIIIPLTMVASRLVEKLKQRFEDVKITAVPRSTFNKMNGMQFVRKICAPAWNSIFLMLQHKYYALTAANALLTYTETHLYTYYAKESIKVEYQESEGFAIIDAFTADKLELVACALPDFISNISSLYGILNHCVTKIGARTLRASILQPPCFIPDIEERLDCVEELVMNPDKIASVQTLLKQISNIDQLLTLATVLPEQAQNCSARQLNYILLLNSLFDLIEPLKELWTDSDKPFFIELHNTLSCEEFSTLKNLVRATIQPYARPASGEQGIFERCFSIKPGINELLDLIRANYSEKLDAMREYVSSLGEKYNLDLKLSNNNKKWYHIVLNLNAQQRKSFKTSDLPKEFIQIERMRTMVTMKTIEILTFSNKLEDVTREILKISNILIYDLLIEVRKRVGLFYKLCEDIAKLDMLQSLAQASSSNHKYVRPKFGEITELLDSRHPLLDFICEKDPISNDIHGSPEYNLHIITGPNGSGKSIFIRQLVLLQVMAQVGCFVPATSAIFRVADRILARVYLEDNMNCGASTFVLEMKEIKYFFQVMTDNTLIIIDELCRSTSVKEGTALAMAICEKFLSTKAFVYVTTHYTFITKLWDMHLNVKCWQLEAKEVDKGDRKVLNYTHNVLPGVTNMKGYAIYLARLCWPKHVMKFVDEYTEILKTKKQDSIAVCGIDPRIRLKYDLESGFKILKYKHQLTESVIEEMLIKYTIELEKLGNAISLDEISQNSSFTFGPHFSAPPGEEYSSLMPFAEDSSSLKYANNRSIIENVSSTSPKNNLQPAISTDSKNISSSSLDQTFHSCLYPEVVYSDDTNLDDEDMDVQTNYYGLIPPTAEEDQPTHVLNQFSSKPLQIIEENIELMTSQMSLHEKQNKCIFTPIQENERICPIFSPEEIQEDELFLQNDKQSSFKWMPRKLEQITSNNPENNREENEFLDNQFEEEIDTMPRNVFTSNNMDADCQEIDNCENETGKHLVPHNIMKSYEFSKIPKFSEDAIPSTSHCENLFEKIQSSASIHRRHCEIPQEHVDEINNYETSPQGYTVAQIHREETNSPQTYPIPFKEIENRRISPPNSIQQFGPRQTLMLDNLEDSGSNIDFQEFVEGIGANKSLNRGKFSVPKQHYPEKTSTPLHPIAKSLDSIQKNDNLVFKKPTPKRGFVKREVKKIEDRLVQASSPKYSPNTKNTNNNSKLSASNDENIEYEKNEDGNIIEDKGTVTSKIADKKLKSELDVSEILEDLQNCSSSFIEDWIPEDVPKPIPEDTNIDFKHSPKWNQNKIEDPDIIEAIDDLESCSASFAEDWDFNISNSLPTKQNNEDTMYIKKTCSSITHTIKTDEENKKKYDTYSCLDIDDFYNDEDYDEDESEENSESEDAYSDIIDDNVAQTDEDEINDEIEIDAKKNTHSYEVIEFIDGNLVTHEIVEDKSTNEEGNLEAIMIINKDNLDEDCKENLEIHIDKLPENKKFGLQNSGSKLDGDPKAAIVNQNSGRKSSIAHKDSFNIIPKYLEKSKMDKTIPSQNSLHDFMEDDSTMYTIISVEETSKNVMVTPKIDAKTIGCTENSLLQDVLEDDTMYSLYPEEEYFVNVNNDMERPVSKLTEASNISVYSNALDVSLKEQSKRNGDDGCSSKLENDNFLSVKAGTTLQKHTVEEKSNIRECGDFEDSIRYSPMWESIHEAENKTIQDVVVEKYDNVVSKKEESGEVRNDTENETIHDLVHEEIDIVDSKKEESGDLKVLEMEEELKKNDTMVLNQKENEIQVPKKPIIEVPLKRKKLDFGKTTSEDICNANKRPRNSSFENTSSSSNLVFKSRNTSSLDISANNSQSSNYPNKSADITNTKGISSTSANKSTTDETSEERVTSTSVGTKTNPTISALQSPIAEDVSKEKSTTSDATKSRSQTKTSTDTSVENNIGSPITGAENRSLLLNKAILSAVSASQIDRQNMSAKISNLVASSKSNIFKDHSKLSTSKGSNIFEDSDEDISFTLTGSVAPRSAKRRKLLKSTCKKFEAPFVKREDDGVGTKTDLDISKKLVEDYKKVTNAGSSNKSQDRTIGKDNEGFGASFKKTAVKGNEKNDYLEDVISKSLEIGGYKSEISEFPGKISTGPSDVGLVSKKNKSTGKLKPITKHEIDESIHKRNMEMIKDNTNYVEYSKEILNRPSVKQLQATKQLVIARRDGSVIVPRLMQKNMHRKFLPPLKHDVTIGKQFDVSLFSDENEKMYEAFMTTEKDSDFDFTKFSKNVGLENAVASCSKFRINPIEVTHDIFPFDKASQASQQTVNRSTTSTGDGYYKRHQDEVNSIINKYLNQ